MNTPSPMHILIVGGGTAGWLTAAIVAAKHKANPDSPVKITVLESSDIPIVGVGEGTWPTLKNTFKDIGLQESDVFKHCSAAFKQGGKFVDWVHGNGDFYHHPFTVPLGYGRLDLAPYVDDITHFAESANFQHHVCEAGLAPRTMAESEYQGPCNYGYHVDAGALGDLLRNHCKDVLGVEHKIATVSDVQLDADGSIQSLSLDGQPNIDADLYVDCTGFASLLLGKAMDVPFVDVSDTLFNDGAYAVHVPYETPQDPIASNTVATGQTSGWIWDIGLTSRRGVGHVFSSQYISDDEACAQLLDYIGEQGKDLEPRKIAFKSGYRKQFWKQNCIAVGLASGFVEPLEATAIMLVEIAARYIADNVFPDHTAQAVAAKRYNQQMAYRWQRIIDFLKLHYMLTQRPEPYWQAHRNPDTIPDSLKEDLALWQCRGPISADFDSAIELFPAASYQYVLYGMGFRPDFNQQAYLHQRGEEARRVIKRNHQLTDQLLNTLPPHRMFINNWLKAVANERSMHGNAHAVNS